MTSTLSPPRPPAPAPRAHPRIRQRRIAVKRDQGRRRLRLILAAAGLSVALACVYGVLHSPWLRVSRVVVTGLVRTPPATLTRLTADQLHRPMIDAGGAQLSAAIDRLPWVEGAVVTRRWPSTLQIAVTERVAVAQALTPAGWALVDGSGRVVAAEPGQAPGLVVLGSGAWRARPGSALGPAAGELLAALRQVPADLRGRLNGIVPDAGAGVSLQLAGGTTVDLGPLSDLSAKMAAFDVLAAQVDLTRAATVDLRLPDQPLVTPRQPGS